MLLVVVDWRCLLLSASAADEFADWLTAPGAREAVRRLADLFAMVPPTTDANWWQRLFELTRTAPPRDEDVASLEGARRRGSEVDQLEKAHLAFSVDPYSSAAFDLAQIVGWWFTSHDPELVEQHMADLSARALPSQLHGGVWSWRSQSFGAQWVQDVVDAAWVVTRAYAAAQVRQGGPAPWRDVEQRDD
ncbi:hypothetical protein SAMN04489732_14232 [Amycolatopsis saalfeldensis]|uniref:Uncharacterized protein n=1 Tax=Amycolatopsis saalfeldensis TaxID=394193 RepID=A0A1H8YSE3_9PSEU|nr:hypothetical protein SAMN04489732_14232 [Amycolatopsis saalfeldensis]